MVSIDELDDIVLQISTVSLIQNLNSFHSTRVPPKACNMSEVKNRRVTITKNLVGQVKTSAYALPDNDFVYGIESKLDPEGAGNGKR